MRFGRLDMLGMGMLYTLSNLKMLKEVINNKKFTGMNNGQRSGYYHLLLSTGLIGAYFRPMRAGGVIFQIPMAGNV